MRRHGKPRKITGTPSEARLREISAGFRVYDKESGHFDAFTCLNELGHDAAFFRNHLLPNPYQHLPIVQAE